MKNEAKVEIHCTVNGEEKVKDNITFNKVDNNYTYYISSTKTINKIECNQVIEIISETGDNINFNCSEEKLLIKGSSEPKNIDDQWTKTELLIIGTFILIVSIHIGIQNDPIGVF